MTDTFKVYKVSFLSLPTDHVALFVETDSDGKGYMFHAVDSVTKIPKYRQMKYEERKDYNPDTSQKFQQKTLLGTILKTNFSKFEAICAEIPAPGHPIPMKNSPNCITWLNNAIFKLCQQNLLMLSPGVSAPSSEKVLVYPPVQAKDGSKPSSSSM